MVSVTGVKADRMATIDASSLVDSDYDGPNLLLKSRAGVVLNAGNAKGPAGTGGLATTYYKAISSATTSLTNNIITAVPGWSFLAGTSGLFTYNGTTDFTATQAGIYVVNFSVTYAYNATQRRIAMIYKNGGELRRQDIGAAGSPSSGTFTLQIEHIFLMAIGDILTLRAYQNSGAALALGASPGHDVNILKVA